MALASFDLNDSQERSPLQWVARSFIFMTRAAGIACHPVILLAALMAVTVTWAGWDALLRGSAVAPRDVEPLLPWRATPDSCSILPCLRTDDPWCVAASQSWLGGPLLRGWSWALQPLEGLIRRETNAREKLALAAATFWSMAVWSFFGATCARYCVSRLADKEPLGIGAALRGALGPWRSTIGALAGVFLAAGLLLGIGSLIGWFLQFALGVYLTGLVWPVAMLVGLALAFVAAGATLGWPLMATAGAVEESDAFDQVGRAFAYLYQRPLRLACYLVIASCVGLLCEWAVWGVTETVVATTRQIAWNGSVASSTVALGRQGGPGWLGAAAIQFWESAAFRVAQGFALAYLWTVAGAVYLLLRCDIDGVNTDD